MYAADDFTAWTTSCASSLSQIPWVFFMHKIQEKTESLGLTALQLTHVVNKYHILLGPLGL